MAIGSQSTVTKRARAILELLDRCDGGNAALCSGCISTMLPHGQSDIQMSIEHLEERGFVTTDDGHVSLTSDGEAVLVGASGRGEVLA